MSALLVHSWFPQHDIHYGINPVAWYLCALLFCYLIYPFLAHWLGRWCLRYKVVLALALAALLAMVLLPLDIPGREAVFVNPLSHVLDVVVGLILIHLYHLLKARSDRVSFGTATMLEVVALLMLAPAIAINVCTTWVKPWEDVLIWLLPQGAILLVFALLNGHEGAIGKFLLCKPLQWLGSISFEVYVLQVVAFHLFNYVVSPVAGHFGCLVYDKLAWLALLLLLPPSRALSRDAVPEELLELLVEEPSIFMISGAAAARISPTFAELIPARFAIAFSAFSSSVPSRWPTILPPSSRLISSGLFFA